MLTGLDGEPQLYIAAALFVVGHLVLFAYVLRRMDARTSPAGAGDDAGQVRPDPPDDLPPVESEDSVVCPHCSVENDPEFRLCRYCTGELRGGARGTGQRNSPQRRGMF